MLTLQKKVLFMILNTVSTESKCFSQGDLYVHWLSHVLCHLERHSALVLDNARQFFVLFSHLEENFINMPNSEFPKKMESNSKNSTKVSFWLYAVTIFERE